jgi:hypothetical protein
MASPESPDKGAGGGDSHSPMERFRRLTKKLLDVPVPELKEADLLYQQEREASTKRRKAIPGPPVGQSKAKPAA